jgi:hypothetical protein
MSKGAIAKAIAAEHGLKPELCLKILNTLATIAAREVKMTGKFKVAAVVKLVLARAPAVRQHVRSSQSCPIVVKAKPPRNIVKAIPMEAIKKAANVLL